MRLPVEEKLSSRELEVLGLVAGGLSNSDIGGRLHISQATVKSHLIHIFGKLGVSDRTAAVTVALQRGLIRLEP
jgi:ATP/maltotriose-dependent transcriptional regulator MalT